MQSDRGGGLPAAPVTQDSVRTKMPPGCYNNRTAVGTRGSTRMTTQAPSKNDSSTFRPRVRRLGPGHYLVESATKPGTGHPVTVDHCPCKGFSYRGTCRHIALVQALEPAMQQWYGQATTPTAPVDASVVVPMTAGAPSGIVRPVMPTPPVVAALDVQVDEAEVQLAYARRALHDADQRDDSYAVLWRQVDGLEREVAALHWQAMRAA